MQTSRRKTNLERKRQERNELPSFFDHPKKEKPFDECFHQFFFFFSFFTKGMSLSQKIISRDCRLSYSVNLHKSPGKERRRRKNEMKMLDELARSCFQRDWKCSRISSQERSLFRCLIIARTGR